MELIPVQKSFEETYRQLLFTDRYLVSAANRKYLIRGVVYAVFTVAIVLIFIFTDSSYGASGIFILPLFWVCFGLYLLYLRWRTHKRRKVILKELAQSSIEESSSDMRLSFTEDEVSVMQNQSVTSVKWDSFRAFLEEEDTVYLFQDEPYAAWSFSEKEIGSVAVSRLKELARSKLPIL